MVSIHTHSFKSHSTWILHWKQTENQKRNGASCTDTVIHCRKYTRTETYERQMLALLYYSTTIGSFEGRHNMERSHGVAQTERILPCSCPYLSVCEWWWMDAINGIKCERARAKPIHFYTQQHELALLLARYLSIWPQTVRLQRNLGSTTMKR